jgi:hypothetical protein
MFNNLFLRHPFWIAVVLIALLGLGWMRGWFSSTVAFRSIMHDSLLGRQLNHYTPQGPAVACYQGRATMGMEPTPLCGPKINAILQPGCGPTAFQIENGGAADAQSVRPLKAMHVAQETTS